MISLAFYSIVVPLIHPWTLTWFLILTFFFLAMAFRNDHNKKNSIINFCLLLLPLASTAPSSDSSAVSSLFALAKQLKKNRLRRSFLLSTTTRLPAWPRRELSTPLSTLVILIHRFLLSLRSTNLLLYMLILLNLSQEVLSTLLLIFKKSFSIKKIVKKLLSSFPWSKTRSL